MVQDFQEKPDVQLMLPASSGGTDSTSIADHVYLLDPGEPSRRGSSSRPSSSNWSNKPVFIHRLVAKDTVEEAILELQAAKKSLAEAAIGDRSDATRITREDILALTAA